MDLCSICMLAITDGNKIGHGEGTWSHPNCHNIRRASIAEQRIAYLEGALQYILDRPDDFADKDELRWALLALLHDPMGPAANARIDAFEALGVKQQYPKVNGE